MEAEPKMVSNILPKKFIPKKLKRFINNFLLEKSYSR